MSSETQSWRRCSSCKKDIGFQTTYWRCNVSTCNRKRTGMVFCTVSCWEAHVPVMRHRESWAVEETSPTREAWRREQAETAKKTQSASRTTSETAPRREPKRTIIRGAANDASRPTAAATEERATPTHAAPRPPESEIPKDILIVTSKLKSYIRAVSGMNTSDAVTRILSDHVRALCDQAIEEAHRNERRTVMERDYPKPPRR